MTIEQFYGDYLIDDARENKSRELLEYADWYTSILNLDPVTAEPLPQKLSSVLKKISSYNRSNVVKDRLWRITEHARDSLIKLFDNLNESSCREHAILPLHAVRELDMSSFMALSYRPGRNIREKLAGKPYMKAVRHFQSFDLPENRLLKTFSERLVELLELRVKCLGEEPDELIQIIYSWLATDEARSIKRWDNLPPNNTLLSHRHYRAIYDSWIWLQSLDCDISNDLDNLELYKQTKKEWDAYADIYKESQHVIAEQPVLFNYDGFEINTWSGKILYTSASEKFERFENDGNIEEPVCVDLTELFPSYAFAQEDKTQNFFASNLPYPLIWQIWKNQNISADIDLFNADAVYFHPEANTISSSDLFFSKGIPTEYLERAAKAFAGKLKKSFQNDTILWLQPDFIHDFELLNIRRNINSYFPNAKPLPRSIAAIFEAIDYTELKKGYSVLVVDGVGEKQYATKLEAKHDKDLEKRLPVTRGFYWECAQTVLLRGESEEPAQKYNNIYDIATVGPEEDWGYTARQSNSFHVAAEDELRRDKKIGEFSKLLNISSSPVKGGIKFYMLQKQAGDIPLWRAQIPELSIKAFGANGAYLSWELVSRNNIITPIYREPVEIHNKKEITLPKGKSYYQFPLYIGNNEDKLGFSAKLESPFFPLKDDLKCKLKMTYTYGIDDPYVLMFVPQNDKSIPPIQAKWARTVENIITDAPAPEYPKPMTWEDLKEWRDPQGKRVDLLEWTIDSLQKLKKLAPIKDCKLRITQDWKYKREYEHWYTFAENPRYGSCYCNTKNLSIDSVNPNVSHPKLTEILCYIQKKGKGYCAYSSSSDIPEKNIIYFREKSLQNRLSLIFGDARSINDPDCPPSFSKRFRDVFYDTIGLFPLNLVEWKMRFLEACMHKDCSAECHKWIVRQIGNKTVKDKAAVGFILGDLSQPFQKEIFNKLLENLGSDVLQVFSYAIWREKSLVEKFSYSQCKNILERLLNLLKNIKRAPGNDKKTIRNWRLETMLLLDLLLGMLRTRNSSNRDIKMLLQPNQRLTKDFAEQIERISKVVADSEIALPSRIKLANLPPKTFEDKTCDVLYALRLYLTGDDAANAIQISDISDEDAD